MFGRFVGRQISLVSSFTENVNLCKWGDQKFIFFLGGPLDLLEFRDRKRGVLRIEWD